MEYYVVIGIYTIVILFIIIYIFMRDNHNSKQIRIMAMSLDKANKEIFTLKKELNKKFQELEEHSNKESQTIQDIENILYDELEKFSHPVNMALQDVEYNLKSQKQYLDSRMDKIDKALKNMSIPQSFSSADQDKINKMALEGIHEDHIAKELRVSKAEVDFALKMSKFK